MTALTVVFTRAQGRAALVAGVLVGATCVAVPALAEETSVGTVSVLDSESALATDETALVSVDPARLLDTREGASTVDDLLAGGGRVAGGSVTTVAVAGRADVDESASAAMLNVAAVGPSSDGFLTVFDCADEVPNASSVNFVADVNSSNGSLAQIDADGDVCVYSSVDAHLLVDVTAFVPADGSPMSVAPSRLVDTRVDAAADATIDGLDVGSGPVSGGTVQEVVVAGRGDVPADAAAAVLNVTAVQPAAAGYLTVAPCGTSTPLASNLNYVAGTTVPNLAIVGLGPDGSVCIYSEADTDLLVDVSGFVDAGGTPTSVIPARLSDSRLTGDTVDDANVGEGDISAGATRTVPVNGRGGVASGAETVVLNVTAVRPESPGFFTVAPCGGVTPNASSVNFDAGDIVANLVVVGVGSNGAVCVSSSVDAGVIVDVSGYVDVEPDPEPTGSCEETAAAFSTGGSVNPGLADPESSAVCTDDTVIVSSNGIPDYTYIRTSPGDPAPQDHTFEIPGTPTVAATPSDVARLGSIAVATNGVPIYGPTEGTGGDVLSLGGALSDCGSHNGPTGFHLHLAGTSTTTDCMFTPEEVAASPQLLGYAFDGYPIYTGNDQYTSSWVLSDASLFATDTWSAHTYVAGSGDLDECNGLTDANGDYAYYTTDTFPYVLGCYTGVATENGGGPGGPPR